MVSKFASNSEYLEKQFPQLFRLIQSTNTFQDRQAISLNTVKSANNHINDHKSLVSLIRSSLQSQFNSGVQRIMLPRVQSNYELFKDQKATDILEKSIDDTKSYLLDSLPNLSQENYKPDAQKNYLAKDLILMGSLGLAELDSLIESCCINNLLVVDDGYESMVQLMDIADFEDIIHKCKKNRISLHFVVEQDLDSILNLLKKTLACEMFSSCFGFYLVISPPPSALLESVSQWLRSQEGLAEFLMGLLGQETDEINQSVHSIYNYRLYKDREMLKCNEIKSDDVLIVASGPSLDRNIEELKSIQNSITIISAGSAIGSFYAMIYNLIMPFFLKCLLMYSGICVN